MKEQLIQELNDVLGKYDLSEIGGELRQSEKRDSVFLTMTLTEKNPKFSFEGEELLGSRIQYQIFIRNVKTAEFAAKASEPTAKVKAATLSVEELRAKETKW